MRQASILMLFLCVFIHLDAQSKKSYQITRVQSQPTIDGVLNEPIWENLQVATDFIQFRPEVGKSPVKEKRTEVKMCYDDNAIYISAYLHDNPEDVMRQFTQRDNFGQSDFFAIILNPNNDAQNNTEFFVFSSGTQADAVENPKNGEDFSWNAVWESAVKIVDDGWVLEVKIPYRTLRFTQQEDPTWGIQFHRHFRQTNSQFTWNPIDVTKGNIGLYNGILKGIKNIDPPARLSLYPFASGLVNTLDGDTDTNLNLGLDLKYGLTENFTLDATLIPDFSQAGFDNLELNLGPFEQTFSEQRQFFTEGVDLFSKGNLFFTRRVGNVPDYDIELNEDEDIENLPNSIKVLNAIKVSGRTKKGLGVGFFNAITEKTNVTVTDTINGNKRAEILEPLTNYNVLVIDKQFNKNSSVSFVNTNVTREGHFRDANVTGLLADIRNKRNTYNIEGQIKMSRLNLIDSTQTGYSSYFAARKNHGNYQYGIYNRFVDNNYDINDIGLLQRKNYLHSGVWLNYRIFEPTKRFNSFNIKVDLAHRRLPQPNVHTGTELELEFSVQTKKLVSYGAEIETDLGNRYDYFEPRTEGRFFLTKNKFEFGSWYSSNYNKPFALDLRAGITTFFDNTRDTKHYRLNISPRFRFNDHFLLRYRIDYSKRKKDIGYTTIVNDDIIFGVRDQKVLTNSIQADYNFNPLQSLSFNFRNYWSTVTYQDNLYTLMDNGKLTQDNPYTAATLEDNPNINFNTWNLDLSYSWQFAPGSFLTALYRNRLFIEYDDSREGFSESLSTLLDQPIQHTFSLRVQYFIDYNNVKHLFRNKKSS